MKYKFIDKAKNLTPDEIKSQMNFDNVVKGASVWAGVKLGSAILKLGSKASTAAIAGASTVVIATAVVLTFATDVFDLNDRVETMNVPPVTIADVREEEQEPVPVTVVDTASVTKSSSQPSIAPKPTPSKKKVEKSPVKKTIPQKAALMDSAENKDVLVRARPIPDAQSFRDFVNSELSYPLGVPDTIEGYVKVIFKVNKEGVAEDFKIAKSLGEAFDKEAIRVLKQFQNWEPANFNGDAVDSFLQLKINFQVIK